MVNAILKPIQTDPVVIQEEDYNTYVSCNYDFIQSSVKVGTRSYVKTIKCIIEHFNYVHCGVQIVATSTRSMNEVVTLAEDEGFNLWYQDSDSVHTNYEEVHMLEQKIKEHRGRYLVGDEMGQFHIDFKLEKAKGEILFYWIFMSSPKSLY